MKISTFLLRRLTVGLVSFVFVAGFCLTEVQAASYVQHSLTGNGRAQIGDGLPIPIGFTPAPNGKVAAVPGAIASETTGPDPKALLLPPGQLKYGTILPSPGAATITGVAVPKQVLGVFNTNPAVLEVATQVALYGGAVVQGPPHSNWRKDGRTGLATVTYCPTDVVTDGNNPGCPGGINSHSVVNGIMIYTKTANQFGGPGQTRVGGFATVAFPLAAGAGVPASPSVLGTTSAIMAYANPGTVGAGGGPFGFVQGTTGAPPLNPLGAGVFKVLSNGELKTKTTNIPINGLTNPGTEYGAPWTTGMVTVQVTKVAGLPETFMLTGSDMRVNGQGSISLVAGSVAYRALSKGNANRAWTNLEIGPLNQTPSMSSHGLAAVFGLLALAGGYVADRRRRQNRH